MTKWMAQAPVHHKDGSVISARRVCFFFAPGLCSVSYINMARRTFCIDPFRVEVGQGGLITHLLKRLGWFSVHQTARSSPSPLCFCVHGCFVGRMNAQIGRPVDVAGKSQAGRLEK